MAVQSASRQGRTGKKVRHAHGTNPYDQTLDVSVDPYVRPSDWLSLPTVSNGDQTFVGLVAIWPGTNYISVKCNGNYTVDWGDGGATQNVSSAVQADKTILYSAISNTTDCTRGYRQVIVTITPQAGQNLTTVNLNVRASALSNQSLQSAGWLDIKMAGANVSSLVLSGSTGRSELLEQFEYVGGSSLTTVSSAFSNCRSLQNVVGTAWTSAVTTFSSMFISCSSLQTVPLFDTAVGTTFTSMFSSCSSLQTIP